MLFCVCLGSVRLLNTTVDLSSGTYLLLNTKVVFVSIGSQCLQAKCYSSPSILGMQRVHVRLVDVGFGTCLSVLKLKSFQRLRDPCLLAIEGPAFTFSQCQENFLCYVSATEVVDCVGPVRSFQKCSKNDV